MTIDEVEKIYKAITDEEAPCPRHCMLPCDKCVQECKQVLEWLEELKELRKIKEDYAKGMQTSYATFMYNKAIDDVEREFLKCDKIHYNLQDILNVFNKVKAGGTSGTDNQ